MGSGSVAYLKPLLRFHCHLRAAEDHAVQTAEKRTLWGKWDSLVNTGFGCDELSGGPSGELVQGLGTQVKWDLPCPCDFSSLPASAA